MKRNHTSITPMVKQVYKKIVPLRIRTSMAHYVEDFYIPLLAKLHYRSSRKNIQPKKSKPKSILFYPYGPTSKFYGISRICYLCGYKMTSNPKDKFDLVMNWEDCTWRSCDETLSDLSKKHECLNAQCKDISKRRVQELFKEVFGYPLAVNPMTFQGECIQKSNKNYEHDGKILKCPIREADDTFVYQKLINNRFHNEYVEDIRVPVFRDTIPLVYLKRRSIDDRFDNYYKSVIAGTTDIFSRDEINKITLYCKRMGLDYGELDVLRDNDDGRLYIVDVNNTPTSPPRHLSKKERFLALTKMAQTFEEVFVFKKKTN